LHDEYEDQARQRSLRESRREAARSKLEAPGIAMLIVNGLNVVVALGLLIWGFASLPDASKDMQQARQNAANRNQRVRQPGEANAHDTGFAIGFYAGRLGPHFCGGLLGIAGSIVGFIGGARMLQARSLTTARLAAIVTMIPCTSPACILGLPVGLWALVALSSPEVKRLG
jgi:hypothetical protein